MQSWSDAAALADTPFGALLCFLEAIGLPRQFWVMKANNLFRRHESAPTLRCPRIDSNISLAVNDGRH
jgi:hypothetical protein